MGEVRYVVQVRIAEGEPDGGRWRDAAVFSVPARTKMKTVRRRAGAVVSANGEALPAVLRVIEEQAAKPFIAEAVQVEPQLVIREVD